MKRKLSNESGIKKIQGKILELKSNMIETQMNLQEMYLKLQVG